MQVENNHKENSENKHNVNTKKKASGKKNKKETFVGKALDI